MDPVRSEPIADDRPASSPSAARSAADDLSGGPADPATDGSPAGASDGGLSLGHVLGGLVALVGLLIGLGRLSDNSFLTHLATGRLILEDGGIPRADPYSFTAAGEPWVVQSWLASVLYAGAEELGGLGAIRSLNGVLCAALAVGVWLLTSRSSSIVARLAVTGAVLVAGAEMWTERPLLFGLLGVVAVLLAADGRLDPRVLAPVGWVWVNTHGSFPLGIAALVLLAIGAALDADDWSRERRALGWLSVGFVLGAINPLGPRLLLFPLTVGDRTEAFQSVAEWGPPQLETLGQHIVLAVLMAGVLGLVRRPSWRSALPLVGFGAMALVAARNGSPFLLVAAPVLAGAAPAWGPAVADFRRPILRPAALAVAALAIVFTVSALSAPDTALDRYPVDLVEEMAADGRWGPDSRVLAPDEVGNLRAFQAGADARVFIDDRVDMYPIEIIRDYQAIAAVRPGWDEVLDRHQITAVVWKEDSSLVAALEAAPGWDITDRDSLWVVAERTTSR